MEGKIAWITNLTSSFPPPWKCTTAGLWREQQLLLPLQHSLSALGDLLILQDITSHPRAEKQKSNVHLLHLWIKTLWGQEALQLQDLGGQGQDQSIWIINLFQAGAPVSEVNKLAFHAKHKVVFLYDILAHLTSYWKPLQLIKLYFYRCCTLAWNTSSFPSKQEVQHISSL